MRIPASTRVLVVDDHTLVRRGTREILEHQTEIRVVGEAADGDEAVSLTDRLRPDVVLMDLGLPGLGGVEATREIKARWPEVQVLVLTVHDDDQYVFEAIRAGASGYLLKDVHDNELIDAVLAVAEGGVVLQPAVARRLVAGLRTRGGTLDEPPPTKPLTDRELQVLRLVAKGLSNREVSELLGVSARTVETHLSHVYRKLGASSRTEAVISGLKDEWLKLDEIS
ncbi:MAG: response regulator transcription factor [Acidimicrobiia bacterium]|nr:MAG: response regulator transcription factor [Acidimicrobiia bacterium]